MFKYYKKRRVVQRKKNVEKQKVKVRYKSNIQWEKRGKMNNNKKNFNIREKRQIL